MKDLRFTLDRSSPVPLYFQVSRQIEEAIYNGAMPPGARLENELSMADRFGLSRPTIRRAIQELVTKGLVVRHRGIGTQVVDNPEVKREIKLTSLYDDLARSGMNPVTRVLAHEMVPAEEHVAEQLSLSLGTEVVYLERLRYASDEPLALMHNWLPTELGGALTTQQLESHGLYELLRDDDVRINLATQRIGARLAAGDEGPMLGVRRGAPLLTMERTTYNAAGRAVELGQHIYRADAYSFEVVLVDR
ncbi:MAG: GntR family transcriptional regulator [Egibacteraceae bacterium]